MQGWSTTLENYLMSSRNISGFVKMRGRQGQEDYIFLFHSLLKKRLLGGIVEMESKEIAILSEEDAKVKVVIPLLKSLGFHEEDLEFEGSFYIRLGKNTLRVGKDISWSRQGVGGRYDILVRWQGQNLCIVETKGVGQKLNDDDRDQAISYARLTDPICPFALVTNGLTTKIYDVITREEVHDRLELTRGTQAFKVGLDEESKLRHEALMHFIGLSVENLEAFSALQIKHNMERLQGSVEDKALKKYIPDLFVHRNAVDSEFLNFQSQHSKKVFGVIGPSGSGKTNWICNACTTLRTVNAKALPLYYSGMDLGDNLVDTIARDFNIVFSTERSRIELLRSVSSLLRKNNMEMYVFLDALDEWRYEDSPRILDEFIDIINTLDSPIRLVVTCKSASWNRFAVRQGSPSRLSLNLYSQQTVVPEEPQQTKYRFISAPPPVYLGYFNDEEISEALRLYEETYRVEGLNSPVLRHIVREPFMLRLVSEVYEGEPIPSDVAEERLFMAYLNKKQSVTGIDVRSKLTQIVRVLFKMDTTWAYKSDLCEYVTQQDLDLLVSNGILLESSDSHGRQVVTVYFNPLRDYILALDVLKLDLKGIDEFKQLVEEMLDTEIGQSSLSWYYRIATPPQKTYLDSMKEMQAIRFVTYYKELIELNVPSLKQQFEPFTVGEIGLVVVFRGLEVYQYGFKRINDGENILHIVEDGDIPLSEDIPVVHFDQNTFMNRGAEQVAKEIFASQLLKIVLEGRLVETNITSLTREKLYGLAYLYGRQLGISVHPPFLAMDIDLVELQRAVRKFQSISVAWEEYVKGKCRDVRTRAQELYSSGQALPIPRVAARDNTYFPFSDFYTYIQELKDSSFTSVRPVIPRADIEPEGGAKIDDLYTLTRKQEVVKIFYDNLLKSLREIIRLNFAYLKKPLLPFPIKLTVHFDPAMNWPIREVWERSTTGEDTVAVIFQDSAVPKEYVSVVYRGFNSLIQPSQHFKYPTPGIGQYTPVRSRVYDIILRSLRSCDQEEYLHLPLS